MKEAYYIALHEEHSDWDEDYSMLKGSNGWECCLTETEDRCWYKDGAPVITELNRLHAKNAELTEQIKAKDEEIKRLNRIVELDEQIEQALKGE